MKLVMLLKKQLLHKKSLLLRMILSYVVIGAAMLSVFSYISIRNVYHNLTNQVVEVTDNMLMQSYNSTKLLLSAAYDYYYRVYDNEPLVISAMQSHSFDKLEMAEIGQKLIQLTTSNPLVRSIYVYNFDAGLVFSNEAPVSTVNNFYDQGIIQIIKENKFNKYGLYNPRNAVLTLRGDQVGEKYISVIYTDSLRGSDVRSAMIVNFDESIFQELIFGDEGKNASLNFVVDKNGNAVTFSDRSLINQKIEASYITKILNLGQARGYFRDEVNGKKALISYFKTEDFGWNYISVIYDDVSSDGKGLIRSLSYNTVIFVLVGIIISLIFTWTFYKPIHELKKELQPSDADKGIQDYNEYEFIHKGVRALRGHVQQLETIVTRYEPAKKSQMVRQIIQGEFRWEQGSESEFNTINVNFEMPYFVVVTFVMNSLGITAQENSSDDTAILRYGIMNIGTELLGNDYYVEMVEDSEKRLCALISLQNAESDVIYHLKRTISMIQDNVKKYFGFSLSVYIGNVVDSFHKIKNSYRNSLHVAEYKMVFGENCIVKYGEDTSNGISVYEYPNELEKKILDAVKCRDQNKLHQGLNDFVDAICCFAHTEIILSVSQLIIITIKMLKDICDFSQTENDFLSLRSIHQTIENCVTPADIKQWLIIQYNEFLNKIEFMQTQEDDSKKEIIDKTKAFVEKNCCDVNFSIDTVADYVKLSSNYLRIIYKEHTKQSLSDYISERRFNKACMLLRNSEYSVKEIAEMTGYSTNGYFYTAFKKYTGMTPDQYRKRK